MVGMPKSVKDRILARCTDTFTHFSSGKEHGKYRKHGYRMKYSKFGGRKASKHHIFQNYLYSRSHPDELALCISEFYRNFSGTERNFGPTIVDSFYLLDILILPMLVIMMMQDIWSKNWSRLSVTRDFDFKISGRFPLYNNFAWRPQRDQKRAVTWEMDYEWSCSSAKRVSTQCQYLDSSVALFFGGWSRICTQFPWTSCDYLYACLFQIKVVL